MRLTAPGVGLDTGAVSAELLHLMFQGVPRCADVLLDVARDV